MEKSSLGEKRLGRNHVEDSLSPLKLESSTLNGRCSNSKELEKRHISDFVFRARRLCSIDRCSNTPHIGKYPVSEHSFYTALYAMLFADLENSKLKRYDTSEVIKRALIHDIEESVTGDILFPVKHGSDQVSALFKTIAIKCVEQEVFEGLPENIKQYYINLWKSSKDGSEEGLLVSGVDKFEILIYALTEVKLGNTQFGQIIDTAYNIIVTQFSNIESLVEVTNQLVNDYRKEANLDINFEVLYKMFVERLNKDWATDNPFRKSINI